MKNKMKSALALALTLNMAFNAAPVLAAPGDMGFFGGTTEGTRLPKTTELLLEAENGSDRKTDIENIVYKEVVFLSGTPVVFEGLLSVTSGKMDADKAVGSYTVQYRVRPSDTTAEGVSIDRNITFNVNFRKEGRQIIKDYEVTRWTETINAGSDSFTLDSAQSRFGVSIIEDHTPGVIYYKGNISQRAVYTAGGAGGAAGTTLEASGSFYGYESAWSNTETYRIDSTVYAPAWQMQFQVRPSVSVAKILQYDQNEPTAISFEGNYKEVMQNLSGLEYDIFMKPKQFLDTPDSGRESIPSYNSFEQLIAPNLNFLKGHFAESDIKKLFAMQVLDGDPKFYQPAQSITRGQYVTALVKAVKLPVAPTETKKKTKKNDVVNITFPDVTEDRPEYPYIMAAYKSGLAVGRENGWFFADRSIERQEAVVILLRTLGLENLGLDPTPVTPFVDDYEIAGWAKKEVYAAQRLGIISGDADGNFHPKDYVTKAEAAALVNRLIDYMREDMKLDYADHIVNYAS